MAYEAYDAFEKFIRPASMTISDYIIHFEKFHNKAKGYKMEIHDGVLAYRLLNNTTISESHKQLIRATLPDLRYTTMKEQLKRVFAKTVTTESIEAQQPKSEFPVKFESDGSSGREDVYFSDKRGVAFKKEKILTVTMEVTDIEENWKIGDFEEEEIILGVGTIDIEEEAIIIIRT